MLPVRSGFMALVMAALATACAYQTDQPVTNTTRPAVQPKFTQPPPQPAQPTPAFTPAEPRQAPAATPTMTPREPAIQPTPPPEAAEAPRITERSASSDPLQACLDRIPKDASAGQRSFGEQTCARDYEAQSSPDQRPYASGTQGDTVDACMSRIPADATAGQRMIAEESCQRDEDTRGGIGLVPGR